MEDDQSSKHLLASDKKEKDGLKCTIIKPTRTIILEPLFVLYISAVFGIEPLTSQYIYVAFGRKYNFSQGGIGNNNETVDPCNVNTSDPIYELQQKVQNESSMFFTWFRLCTSILSLFSAFYLGGYTDNVGRRPGLLCPLFGISVRAIITVAVIYFELDVNWLFVAGVIYGLFGDANVWVMAAMAYIADCTTHTTRSMRLLISESIAVISISFSGAFIGIWIQSTGFFWPMLCIGIVLLVSLVYAFFFIPETVVKNRKASLSMPAMVRKGLNVFKENKPGYGKTGKLGMLLCALTIMRVLTCQSNLRTLYYMNSPFCFNSAQLGILLAAGCLALFFGSIFAVVTFTKCLKLHDITVVLVSFSSCIAKYTMVGIGISPLIIWISIPVSLFEGLASPLLRGEMSKMVSLTEQGSLFSIVTVCQGIFQILLDPLSNVIYSATLEFHKGFAFLLTTGLFVIGFIVTCFYKYRIDSERKLENTRAIVTTTVGYGSLRDEEALK